MLAADLAVLIAVVGINCHLDHLLRRVTYLDPARRWRKIAHEAESLERKATGQTKRTPRTAEQVFALSGSGPRAA